MDIKAVAGKIAGYVIPFFKKSKTIKQISQEIGDAADNELSILWNAVKGCFIEEYEEETPIDDTFEAEDIKTLIKSELKRADDATKANIEKALEQKSNATTHIQQTHTGTGDNVGGDKKVYNINKVDNANFS